MTTIGLIRETKIPADNRVAFTPAQCKWILKNSDDIRILVESSPDRCYNDKEYQSAGVTVTNDLTECDILFGIKEVKPELLIPGKTYLFFSHTRKKQEYNQKLFQTILNKKITLIDYECLEHEDGQRILGFGFFAGIVGAHNGMMAYGKRTGAFQLERVYRQKSFRELIHTYFGIKLPPLKIVVTGSGRVAHGVLEIMNLMEVIEVEPAEYLSRNFAYPVFTQLKGADLYAPKTGSTYNRQHFHDNPSEYKCLFEPYSKETDILMNGIYWDEGVPRLFETGDLARADFKIKTIADITNDKNGSVPVNLGDSTIEDPVYGVHRKTLQRTQPYLDDVIDVMSVGNLPNELPRDASRYFGEQLIKHVLKDLVTNGSAIIDRATMVEKGKLTERFIYLDDYARY
ncbi:MAG: alanine dehydrogenase [Chitinophagaceae bacterium]|nr:alanine dehydrogenase [Chitinophagaceae bacterium]